MKKSLTGIDEDKAEVFDPPSMSENQQKDLDDVNKIDLRKYQVKVKTKKEEKKTRIFSCPTEREGKKVEVKIF